jgi:hypothetical protein
MLQSPNYIHFRSQWQLLGPGAPGQTFEKKYFQDLMNALNQPPEAVEFDDFSYRPERCEMGKVRGGRPNQQGGTAFTKLVYMNDQLTFVEEWADITADEFKQRFVKVLTGWFRFFPGTAIIAQNCCLRALLQPVNYPDSRQFIGDHVLQIGQSIQKTFATMPFKVGFNVTVIRPFGNHQLVIDTSINSWRDNRSVWLQVTGSSPLAPPINAANPQSAAEPFEHCKSFLEAEAVGFLNEFDKKEL